MKDRFMTLHRSRFSLLASRFSLLASRFSLTRGTLAALTLLGLAALPQAAQAQTDLPATDFGRIFNDGSGGTNANYFAGFGGITGRNFFVFDLSSVSGTITAATLKLYNPASGVDGAGGNGYSSPDATETYDLTSTTSTPAQLAAGGVPAYNTLGTGTSFNSKSISNADNGTDVLLSFNAAGLSTLNGGIGGLIAVGGQITSISGGATQVAFFFTHQTSGLHRPTLTITTTSSSAPEPGTLALLALGMVGGIVARRRK